MYSTIWITFILALSLMIMQFSVTYIHRTKVIPATYVCSFSAGFTISYIFLHLLPGIAEHRDTIGEYLAEKYTVSPLLYLVVYIVGLFAFLFFYGLEKVAHRKNRNSGQSPTSLDFYIHLFSICLYCVLITYTMPVRVETGLPFAILFTIVMGFHFVIVDSTLDNHYPRYFDKAGRFIIMASLFVGWIISVISVPENAFVVAILTAFLGGAILMSVFQHELPKPRQSSFTWLAIGAAVGTVLLVVMTVLENNT